MSSLFLRPSHSCTSPSDVSEPRENAGAADHRPISTHALPPANRTDGESLYRAVLADGERSSNDSTDGFAMTPLPCRYTVLVAATAVAELLPNGATTLGAVGWRLQPTMSSPNGTSTAPRRPGFVKRMAVPLSVVSRGAAPATGDPIPPAATSRQGWRCDSLCERSRHRRLRPNAAGHQYGIPCLVIERPQRKQGVPDSMGGSQSKPAPGLGVVSAASSTRQLLVALAILTLVGAILRLVRLGHSPPGLVQDEGITAFNAYCLLKTGHDASSASWPIFYYHGIGGSPTTLLMYLLIPFQALAGMGVVTTRLPVAVTGILSIPLIYYIGSRLFGKPVGLVAAAMLVVNPWHF